MGTARITRASIWDLAASGIGYHLDNLGRWLMERHLPIGRAYAALLAPRRPRLLLKPDWSFAEEYYNERRWLACRRGALWEAAAECNAVVPLTLPWHNKTIVNVTLGNDNSLCLYVCGSFEPNEFAFLDQVLEPGMVFLDVGANDGYFTLFAARRLGAGGRVIAVEPSSRERINLQRNIEANGLANVTVVPLALGATRATAKLRLAKGTHSGHNTLGNFAHSDVQTESFEEVTVDALDAVAERLGLTRVDFIKVDVEGAEASVIDGAQEVLRRMRPTLLLEINEMALQAQNRSAATLLVTLQDAFDYEILIFSPETGLLEAWVNNQPLSANIVARPRELGSRLVGRPRKAASPSA
jgi:FkbM family methyltransferase